MDYIVSTVMVEHMCTAATDEGGRAVVLRYTDGGIASFRCKATPGCPTFKLPMER